MSGQEYIPKLFKRSHVNISILQGYIWIAVYNVLFYAWQANALIYFM